MKIVAVTANNKKKSFEVSVEDGDAYSMPYASLDPAPVVNDPVINVYVDSELGDEGFTYTLRSCAEGSVHIDSVLEYNEDPEHLRDLLVHRLTVEAQKCVEASGLSHRELIRRTGTSASQFYRLLDPANTKKSIDKLVVLLSAMQCEVDIRVSPPFTARER